MKKKIIKYSMIAPSGKPATAGELRKDLLRGVKTGIITEEGGLTMNDLTRLGYVIDGTKASKT